MAHHILFIGNLTINTLILSFEMKSGGGLIGALITNSINYAFGYVGVWIVMIIFLNWKRFNY